MLTKIQVHVDWERKYPQIRDLIKKFGQIDKRLTILWDKWMTPKLNKHEKCVLKYVTKDKKRATRAELVLGALERIDTYAEKHGLKGYDIMPEKQFLEVYEKVAKTNEPAIIRALDVVNMGGGNKIYNDNHELADVKFRAMFGDGVVDLVKALNGKIGKFGGDEFCILWVGRTDAEVYEIHATLLEASIEEMNFLKLNKIEHPKHEYATQDGTTRKMPSGAFFAISGGVNLDEEFRLKEGSIVKARERLFSEIRTLAEVRGKLIKEKLFKKGKKNLEAGKDFWYNINIRNILKEAEN